MIEFENIQTGELKCNSYIFYETKTHDALVVDPGEKCSDILPYLKKKQLNLRYVLGTHGHFDHIGCLKDLKKTYDFESYLHQNDKQLYQEIGMQAQIFQRDSLSPAKIDHYLKDQDNLSFFDHEKCSLKVIHTPGHSDGGSCFLVTFDDRQVLLSGDTLFYESIGRTDLIGGSFQKIHDSIRNKLYCLPDLLGVYPGHGAKTSIGYEKKNNPFVNMK